MIDKWKKLIDGASLIFWIFGTGQTPPPPSPKISDQDAIRSDWDAVGNDMLKVMYEVVKGKSEK